MNSKTKFGVLSPTSQIKAVIAGAAAALMLALNAPAAAGGYYDGYYGGYYADHHYYSGYGRARHYRGERYYHLHGGAKAAAIALGVIGGAIIVSEIAEEKARRRAYEARYYDRYSRNRPRYYDDAYEDAYDENYAGDEYYDEGAEKNGEATSDQSINDDELAGARNDAGPAPIRLDYRNAFRACIRHARTAMRERGYLFAGPDLPETAEETSGAWKLTATVTAQDRSGQSWRRAMYCEANDSRVFLLELI